MTREAFERLCFGDWVPSWWYPPRSIRDDLIEGVRRAKREAALPFAPLTPRVPHDQQHGDAHHHLDQHGVLEPA